MWRVLLRNAPICHNQHSLKLIRMHSTTQTLLAHGTAWPMRAASPPQYRAIVLTRLLLCPFCCVDPQAQDYIANLLLTYAAEGACLSLVDWAQYSTQHPCTSCAISVTTGVNTQHGACMPLSSSLPPTAAATTTVPIMPPPEPVAITIPPTPSPPPPLPRLCTR